MLVFQGFFGIIKIFINKTFVEMLDALGYDIQLTYVKKEEA